MYANFSHFRCKHLGGGGAIGDYSRHSCCNFSHLNFSVAQTIFGQFFCWFVPNEANLFLTNSSRISGINVISRNIRNIPTDWQGRGRWQAQSPDKRRGVHCDFIWVFVQFFRNFITVPGGASRCQRGVKLDGGFFAWLAKAGVILGGSDLWEA